MTTLIDVWNLDTFDAALMGELRDQQQLLIDYFATDRTNYLEREASDHRGPIPSNPHASAYYRFAEDLMAVTQTRTIRAWHHTRMTDREVETPTSNGLYIACCLAGLGMIQIPAYDVKQHLEAGELVEVMPGHRAELMPMTLLYPHRQHLSHRLQVFADWLETLLKDKLL